MSLYNKGIKRWLEKWGLAAVMLFILSTFTLSSQDDRRERRFRRADFHTHVHSDSLVTPEMSDSALAVRDSIHRADSLHAIDSLNMLHKSSLEAPAFTTARDSIIEDFSNGKQMIYYYGDVSVTYGNMKLTADYMEYDLKTATLFARGTKDASFARYIGGTTLYRDKKQC